MHAMRTLGGRPPGEGFGLIEAVANERRLGWEW